MNKLFVIFETTYSVMKAERLCKQSGIACQTVPVPRSISSDCGISLEINETDKENVEHILTDNAINPDFRSLS